MKEIPSLSLQVGGDHYKKYRIQPVEYAMANDLNYCQANIIKYVTRYKDKGGLQDLEKALHNLKILMELEYGDPSNRQRYQTSPEEGGVQYHGEPTAIRNKSTPGSNVTAPCLW